MDEVTDIKELTELIDQLNFNSAYQAQLKAINELLKRNEYLRRNINETFFEKAQARFEHITKQSENDKCADDDTLLFQCLRNSAACNGKLHFSQSENRLCEKLTEFIRENYQINNKKLSSIIGIILQYFGNLVQGMYF